MAYPRITLPVDPALPRRWRVTASDIFANYGLTLTLELLSPTEAKAVAAALKTILNRSKPNDD